MRLHDRKSRADAPRLRTLLAATDNCKTCSGMTFARHQCSKLMSRDMGLIGLLRYLPLVQFTKARPVDSLGPFSLESLEIGFVMATRLPANRGCTVHMKRRKDMLESLRDSSSPPGTWGLLMRG